MAADAYKVLGLKPGASADEIKAAYRRAALRWHPDRNPGNAKAAEKFREACAAYVALTNPRNVASAFPDTPAYSPDHPLHSVARTDEEAAAQLAYLLEAFIRLAGIHPSPRRRKSRIERVLDLLIP